MIRYDSVIVKEDCINHISKRLYHGIDTLRSKLRGTKDSMTDKGKCTEKIIKTLTNYFISTQEMLPKYQIYAE